MVVMISIFDPELILENRKGSLISSIADYEEMKEEEPEAHEEFDPYIQDHTEELEELKLYQPRQFADALKAIFVTPLKKEISEQSDNFEYVEPVYELIEAEEFQNPAWIAEMEGKDPDKLFNFFMQADLSIIDELDSKQYEVESFEELVAYHDELMSQPDRQQKSDEAANEILGCLLYTSPSPRDLSTSRMPSSA